MKAFLTALIAVTMTSTAAFASEAGPTLDEILSPEELAKEFQLPPPTTVYLDAQGSRTPDEVLKRYGVNVFAEFPVVVIINTAAYGSTAQRLRLYHDGGLVGAFLTSTGRDQYETPPVGQPYYSVTPTGWYNPILFDRYHFSKTWQASMEYSIFFTGGIAVHATTPDHYAELGQKASGGCVRLTNLDAETVWNLAFNQPRKLVPAFYRNGDLALNRQGQVIRKIGSGVLIIVLNQND